ncbi:phenylalanine 4-monooxygenase [Sphingomonas rhizophila]|uniref:Phenylalanine 4-monooxygenase n=1 Tax=Sphingomonas rhizophila TaxID=2071607 RepID=A0A7G9SB30_9SPHN|nr:phenylalanine 4-monooxygenase [Sphingomonas rhizophila]QNN65055.1 phenylalanine 4-monooxygenase [Sphingomonas rhizophila]
MISNTAIALTDERSGWERHVVPQNWSHFTEDDHAVWDLLFARQVESIGPRLVDAFRNGLDVLNLGHPGIPELGELNARLEPLTGFRCVAVPGLIPDEDFFAMLAERVFPVGNFIRKRAQLDYLEEPDCFHDIFGHVPMLADPTVADLMTEVGRLGVEACAAGEGHLVARIYWHSIEFGLAREDGELRILGAGLASSFGESHYSLEESSIERRPFSLGEAVRTPYRHDAFQPLYLVAEDLPGALAAIRSANLETLERLAAQ